MSRRRRRRRRRRAGFKEYFALFAILLGALYVLYSGLYLPKNVSLQGSKHVVLISFDGLRSSALKVLKEDAPTFYFLAINGASTMNARTVPSSTTTMPNHTSMLTGLPMEGMIAHHVKGNATEKLSVHDINGHYVFSVFDVIHDKGMRVAFFASKPSFKFFINSYGRNLFSDFLSGENDTKIDTHYISKWKDSETVEAFMEEFFENKPNFTFLHFSNPDQAAHTYGWNVEKGSRYLKTVQIVDGYLAKIVKAIQADEELASSTILIVTSDHGGFQKNHVQINNKLNYTVPFIVWGAGIAKGQDLYALNSQTRGDPKGKWISYAHTPQPIRNADAANLILSLLELPPVAGSVINVRQDLRVSP